MKGFTNRVVVITGGATGVARGFYKVADGAKPKYRLYSRLNWAGLL
jgi:hypothetical protein